MHAAVVEPARIAQVLGLRRKVATIEQLEQSVDLLLDALSGKPTALR